MPRRLGSYGWEVTVGLLQDVGKNVAEGGIMENALIKAAADNIVKRYSSALEALVLTGSFARGEAIVRKGNAGHDIYVSDLEFMAVIKPEHYPFPLDHKAIERELEGVIAVSVGQTTRAHLKKFKPTIFTLELKRFGKALWGDEGVLDEIPDYAQKDIDPLDGFILLNNRIVEQLKLRLSIGQGGALDEYHFDKGYVQIVNSLLGIDRRYKSLYPEKLGEFLRVTPINDEKLIATVKRAFHHIENGAGGELGNEEGLKRWEGVREDMRKVWLLEARALLKDPRMDEARAIKKFPLLQKFPARIKGWVKMIRDGKTAQQKESLPGNFFIASPQFLIYREAVKAYFADEFDRPRAQEVVAAWEKIVK
jgi:hypothetical protein